MARYMAVIMLLCSSVATSNTGSEIDPLTYDNVDQILGDPFARITQSDPSSLTCKRSGNTAFCSRQFHKVFLESAWLHHFDSDKSTETKRMCAVHVNAIARVFAHIRIVMNPYDALNEYSHEFSSHSIFKLHARKAALQALQADLLLIRARLGRHIHTDNVSCIEIERSAKISELKRLLITEPLRRIDMFLGEIDTVAPAHAN